MEYLGVLDAERLGELFDDFGQDGAREVIDAFLRETERHVAVAHAAVAQADTAALDTAMHSIKGGCMLVGAPRLQAAAAALAQQAKAGAGELLSELASELDAAWDATRESLSA